MLEAISGASWANIWAAISAIFTAGTAGVAGWALFRWRKQDELKVKLAFKMAIAEYDTTLKKLPIYFKDPQDRIEHKESIRNLRTKLDIAHNAFLVTENLLSKHKDVKEAWLQLREKHVTYTRGNCSRSIVAKFCQKILRSKFVFK